MTLEEENRILKKEIKILKQQIAQVVGYCKMVIMELIL